MSIYLAAQVAVYHHLLMRHAQDDTFRFSMRKKFRQNPLTEQGLFAGSTPIFFFTLWHIPINSSFFRKEVISYSIRVRPDAKFELSLEITLPTNEFAGNEITPASNGYLSHGLVTELLNQQDASGPIWQVRLRSVDSRQVQLAPVMPPYLLYDTVALVEALDTMLDATIGRIDAAIASYAEQIPAWIGKRISPSEFDLMQVQVKQRCADLLAGDFPSPAAGARNYWTVQVETSPELWARFRQQGVARPLFGQLLTGPVTGSSDGSKLLSKVKAGDIIIVTCGPRRVLGVGMATGQFAQDADQPPAYCPVEWFVTVPVELAGTPFTTGSMHWNRTTKWPQIVEAYAQLSPPLPELEQLTLASAELSAELDALTDKELFPEAFTGNGPNYWAIGAGEGGTFWEAWQAQGIMSIGWEKLGDLRQYNNDQLLRQTLKQHYGGDTTHNNDALACWQFCQEIRPGDYVVVKIGRRKILGVGQVLGDYQYDPTRTVHHNIRQVKWLLTGYLEDKQGPGVPTKTLTSITGYRTFLKPILAELAEPKHLQATTTFFVQAQAERIKTLKENLSAQELLPQPAALPLYSLAQAEQDLFLPTDQIQHLQVALRRKKNLIVQGRPAWAKLTWPTVWPGCKWVSKTLAGCSSCSFTRATATRTLSGAGGLPSRAASSWPTACLWTLCARRSTTQTATISSSSMK